MVIFLLVPTRNLLLPTLKSRAVTLKTELFSSDFIRDELVKRYPDGGESLEDAVQLSDGVFGKALAYMENEEERAAVALVKSYFAELRRRTTYAKLSAILVPEISKNKERLLSVMSCFALALRDILAFSVGYDEKALFFTDEELLSDLTDRLDKNKLITAYETVTRIIRDFAKINVNLATASVSMMLSDDFS